MGLKDPNRPCAALLLVGPTGVGKTELTKVLAEQYFGTQVRIEVVCVSLHSSTAAAACGCWRDVLVVGVMCMCGRAFVVCKQ